MKNLLLVMIIAVFASVNSHPLERHARSAEENEPERCLRKYTPQQLEHMTQFTNNGIIGDYPAEVKEFVLCFLKTIQVFSEKTGFNVDNFVEAFALVDKVKGREILEKCADKNEQKSTPMEWMERGFQCMKGYKLGDLIDSEASIKKISDQFKDSSEESTEQ